MSFGDAVFQELVGCDVVVDTNGRHVYIGRLKRAGDAALVLEDVDVHDSAQSPTPKEIYIMDAKESGIKKNRRSAIVLARHVVSLSLLEDIIEY